MIPDHIHARITSTLASAEVSDCARALLSLLTLTPAHGRDAAISIADCRAHWAARGLAPYSERKVKRAAKELLEQHGVPVGSRRDGRPGYFLCASPEDVDCAERALVAEIRSLAMRVRAINPQSAISRNLCGQLGIQ